MHYVQAKQILSPDNRMNIYRGCQHGCIYCDSRSDCYHMDHAFEDIEVKENSIALLEEALLHKRKKGIISAGAMSDPYMPLEKELCFTRRALEVIDRYGFGASVITKSCLVERDLDLFQQINQRAKCVLQMTLTTYDEDLCRILEPHVCTTHRRFETLLKFHEAGIPTVVWLSPILPFINDSAENLRGILSYCVQAHVKGIVCFNMGMTLREGNREYCYAMLDRYFPGLREKYIRTYGERYNVLSGHNSCLMRIFHETCEQYGIMHEPYQILHYVSTFDRKYEQQMLF